MYFKKGITGLTFVEITIVASILSIIILVAVVIIKPQDFYKKSRDTTRVKNVSQLYEAIIEYKLRNGTYPGAVNTLYRSDTALSSNPRSSNGGWINADLSPYIQSQYIDPINNGNYFYSYTHTESDFELNALLEIKKDVMQQDKGNNPNKFEMGTLFTLIN